MTKLNDGEEINNKEITSTSIYICTKPLQIIISLILIDCQEHSAGKSTIFVIDYFHNSAQVEKLIQKNFKQIETKWFSTKESALGQACTEQCDKLYIDSDVGLKNFIALSILKAKSPGTKIQLYEEGIGTYRNDLSTSALKSKLLPYLGLGYYFGQFWGTERIFVFNTDRYTTNTNSKKPTTKITPSIKEWLEGNEEPIHNIFCDGLDLESLISDKDGSGNASLYLSSWTPDRKIMTKVGAYNNSFIKFHPHLKISPEKSEIGQSVVIPNQIPAEILLLKLTKTFQQIYVYHENSSALSYIQDPKITECPI